MIKDNYLDIHKIIHSPQELKLFSVVEKHGGVLRFVGGAVRDALCGISGGDLDFATDLNPDELVEACEEEGIKTVPIGIKYGTVGVIIGNKVLEVTSLRKDIKTDGRHTEVEFTDNWEEDASRRDLTINAVYADEKGNVFDYYDGIKDLENGVVRFIGIPSQRITEDYLRILRFFRFYSIFGKGPIDKKALQACVENSEGLTKLSMERIRDELFKILLTPNVVKTLLIMQENNILGYIMPQAKNIENLDFLIELVTKENIPVSSLRRLFVIYNPDVELAENMATRLRLSKKERQSFVDWARKDVKLSDFLSLSNLPKLVYRYGKDFCINKLIILLSLNRQNINNLQAIISEINRCETPTFPLKGRDILDQGTSESQKIGVILKELEQTWIDSNFSLTKPQLLEIAAKKYKGIA